MKAFIDRVFKMKKQWGTGGWGDTKSVDQTPNEEQITETTDQATEAAVEAIIEEVKQDIKIKEHTDTKED